ncbi:phage tail tube protein [Paracoccus sp. MBLB3053]|uniref:Phage tail tube protein n=1 Tax=Paracoccus aurantius TaxID=3073814 RepID=A0ABU2HQN3_9RHOB|nr:phage tail tube protein [Paracoccus sp. MBLB3053]MDS9467348.1 phage tail tube protein [Paracoccus sp. MBLB3053]
MPVTNAQIGLNARIGIKGSGSTYAAVAEVSRITPAGWSRNTVDATHLASPDGFAEFIAGLKTATDCTFDVNWIPVVSDPLLAAFEAGKGDFELIFPSGSVAMQFTGIVTAFAPGEISPEGKLTASVTIKPSGKPVLVAYPVT